MTRRPLRHALRNAVAVPFALCLACLAGGCGADTPPTSTLDAPRDSTAVMTTYGVSKLVSDSGYMRYRIIAEEWRMYDKTQPPRQEFPKGIFFERFDQNYKMDLFIEADSAWCFNQNLWRLKGRVHINDLSRSTDFRTEELYWDMQRHLFYSQCYMKITEPTRELEGDRFTANERMTHYKIWQSAGFMPMPNEEQPAPAETAATDTPAPDTTAIPQRPAPVPFKK